MRKLVVISQIPRVDDLIKLLGGFGASHIVQTQEQKESHVRSLRDKISTVERIISTVNVDYANGDRDVAMIMSDISNLNDRILHLNEKIEKIIGDLEYAYPWGNFNIEQIEDLAKSGIKTEFYKCSVSQWDQLSSLDLPVFEVSRFDKIVYSISMIEGNDSNEQWQIFRIIPPNDSYKKIQENLHLFETQLRELKDELMISPIEKQRLIDVVDCWNDELEFIMVKDQVDSNDDLAWISVYCPDDKSEELEKILADEGYAYLSQLPSAEDDPPTLLRFGRWGRLFSPVLFFLGVTPGYREIMPTGIFLLFFCLFFAMLVGDGGYGLVILLGTFLFKKLGGKIASTVYSLFMLMGSVTLFWGAITGLWFGVESISQLAPLKYLIIPSLYSFSNSSDVAIIRICFVLGAIQLSLAHLLMMIKRPAWWSVLSHLGWVMLVWGLWSVIRVVVLSATIHWWAVYSIAIGVVLILLFAEYGESQKGRLYRMAMGVPANLLAGIGTFSDIISYIRLFAVGMAAKYVAVAFNQMALSIFNDGVGMIFFSILILVLGHTVNLLLCTMSVLVHGIRLNFLEFSRHLNIEWVGTPYKPFVLKGGSNDNDRNR